MTDFAHLTYDDASPGQPGLHRYVRRMRSEYIEAHATIDALLPVVRAAKVTSKQVWAITSPDVESYNDAEIALRDAIAALPPEVLALIEASQT